MNEFEITANKTSVTQQSQFYLQTVMSTSQITLLKVINQTKCLTQKHLSLIKTNAIKLI